MTSSPLCSAFVRIQIKPSVCGVFFVFFFYISHSTVFFKCLAAPAPRPLGTYKAITIVSGECDPYLKFVCLLLCVRCLWWNCRPPSAAAANLHHFLMLSHFLWAPQPTPANRGKMERFIGTPVRTPPGFMASRQRLSLSPWRRREERWERDRGENTERSYPSICIQRCLS